MQSDDAAIHSVSDTALWACEYRARETERPDALFRDPLARRLAGARGASIAQAMPRSAQRDWAWVTRTVLFDRFVTEAIAQGADTVLVLAAGLDARPYRMKLPPTLRWIEVDLPGLLDYKAPVLAGERPACALERHAFDLANATARRALFAQIGTASRRAVVLTEGLLIYLAPEEVAALARDLAAVPAFERWIVDLVSPGLLRILSRQLGSVMAAANAPFKFGPPEGPDFFVPHGWRATEIAGLLRAAAGLHRVNFGLRLLSKLPERGGRTGRRPWGGVLRLQRVSGAAA